jgi:hypothetical protein
MGDPFIDADFDSGRSATCEPSSNKPQLTEAHGTYLRWLAESTSLRTA